MLFCNQSKPQIRLLASKYLTFYTMTGLCYHSLWSGRLRNICFLYLVSQAINGWQFLSQSISFVYTILIVVEIELIEFGIFIQMFLCMEHTYYQSRMVLSIGHICLADLRVLGLVATRDTVFMAFVCKDCRPVYCVINQLTQ